MTRSKKPPLASVSDWSSVIQQQGEERIRRENETLATMQEQFPAQVERLKTLDNKELLDHFESYAQRSCADPRQTEIYQNLAEEARKEILRRLER